MQKSSSWNSIFANRGWHGPEEAIVKCPLSIKSSNYLSFLQDAGPEIFGQYLLFQQDNVLVHTAWIIQFFFNCNSKWYIDQSVSLFFLRGSKLALLLLVKAAYQQLIMYQRTSEPAYKLRLLFFFGQGIFLTVVKITFSETF